LLQDDTQAKVVRITMETLKRQDSGRYWCMRNTSGILYPLMGFLLEVSPGELACRALKWAGMSFLPCTLTSER
jgi:trem-like transcript 2 protein